MQIRMFAFLLCYIFPFVGFGETVRVRTHKNISELNLVIEDAKLKFCKEQASACKEFPTPNGSLFFQVKSGKLVLGFNRKLEAIDVFVTAKKITDKKTNQLLPNHLELILKDGKLDIVANIELEEYLLGVLPSEMPASWPIESLKAQAVASRSYVLSKIDSQRNLHFDVDSDIMDQVFKKQKLTPILKNVKLAIDATKGEVLSRNNHPVKAFFHSHCGGHTEMASNVWPGSLGFETVRDPYCTGKSSLNWKQEVNYKELKQFYLSDTKDKTVGNLVKVQKGDRNLSGRLENIYLFFDNNKIRRWSALTLREKVGYGKIKSTKFEIDDSPKGKIVFSGSGFGHGVGLCQHGARAMAALGKSYKIILDHYYPYTKITSTEQVLRSENISLKTSSELNRQARHF